MIYENNYILLNPNHLNMNTILLRIDEEACNEYENFSHKTKLQFAFEISLLIKKVASDAKSAKLSKLIQEVNEHKDSIGINSELLMRLLPID